MEEQEKGLKEELWSLVMEKTKDFLQFLMPEPTDPILLKILKTILKVPVALFMLLISPLLLLLLGIIFAILL